MNGNNTIFSRKLLAMTVAGAMIAPAMAGQNQQESSKNQQASTADQAQQQGNANFQEMDQDQDELLVWREIYVVMDPRLVAANLDQEQIFTRYDANNDDALDEQEFDEFISGLEQSEIASAGKQMESTNQALGGTGNMQASNNAQSSQNTQVNSEAQHGADQAAVLPQKGRYNAGTTSQSTPKRDVPQASEFGNAETTSKTQYLSGSSEKAAGRNQSMQTGQGQQDEYAATTEAGGEYERENGAATRDRLTNRDSRSDAARTVTATPQGQSASQDQSQKLSSAPISSLQEKTVKNSAGETIGEVKNVVINPERGEVGLVVSSGGIMGIGSKKLLAPADELSLSEDNIVWDTSKGKKELKQDAKYRSEEYIEVSDQYESIDELRQAGLSQR